MKLLRLYPAWWRDRYEDEMEAVLDQHPVTFSTVIDLVRGAADAWIFGRRSLMATAGRRRARVPIWMLAIPSVFALALGLQLDWGDALVILQLSGPAVWSAICFTTGLKVLRIRGTARMAARNGLATGLIAWALAWAVGEVLFFINVAGANVWIGDGRTLSGGPALAYAADHLIRPLSLASIGVEALASATFGAALALLGFWLGQRTGLFKWSIVVTRVN